MMNYILKNWGKSIIFGAIYALSTTVMLTLLSTPLEQILKTVFLSTLITTGLMRYFNILEK
jgi:hypothetical protein